MTSRRTIWTDLLGTAVSQRFYDVRGVTTRCLEAGSGPPLLLLHGGGGHAETWARNIPALSPDLRCLAIDMVGHGFTDAPADLEYTTSDVLDHVVSFLDTLGIEKTHVCGESFGGRVAAWLAIRHPERVDRLVLNTSGGLPVDETRQESDVGTLLARMTAALDDPSETTIRSRLEWLFADPGDASDELVEIRMRIYRRPEIQQSLRKAFSLLFDPDDAARYVLTPDRLARIQAPTLVVWTDQNPIHSFEDAKRHLSAIPDARFHLIRDAAHWPQWEQVDVYNSLQRDFLLSAG